MGKLVSDDVVSIRDFFGDLEDPRSAINRKHLLGDLIVISVCAVIAGADGPKAIGICQFFRRRSWNNPGKKRVPATYWRCLAPPQSVTHY